MSCNSDITLSYNMGIILCYFNIKNSCFFNFQKLCTYSLFKKYCLIRYKFLVTSLQDKTQESFTNLVHGYSVVINPVVIFKEIMKSSKNSIFKTNKLYVRKIDHSYST